MTLSPLGEFRESHAPGLIEISFYDRGDSPVALHAVAVRSHKRKIEAGGTLTRCGLAVTPFFNEWRPEDEARALLGGPSGCPACLAAL